MKSPRFFKPITFVHGSVAKWLALRSFDHILCNSVATKNDAVRLLQANPEKITVVHLGLAEAFQKLPSTEAVHRARTIVGNDDLPFVLFVGTIEPRKNLEGLLHGFKLSGLNDNHRLVVVGAKGWMTSNISKLIRKLELFIQPIFTTIPINFVGVDVGLCEAGKLYVMEINKSPGVAIFVRDNGLEPVVKMMKYILEDLS